MTTDALPEDYHQRLLVEQALVSLIDDFDNQLERAWREYHDRGQLSSLHMRIQWAASVELVSEKEIATWRHALVVRNATLQMQYRIVLDDIRERIADLTPLVNALPARIRDLGTLR